MISKILADTFSVPISTGTGGQVEPSPFTDLGLFITTLFQAFIIIAGLGTFVYLILGGFQYITSGGDKIAAQAARDRITYAILGLVVIAAAVAVFSVLGAVLGVNILGTIHWPGPS